MVKTKKINQSASTYRELSGFIEDVARRIIDDKHLGMPVKYALVSACKGLPDRGGTTYGLETSVYRAVHDQVPEVTSVFDEGKTARYHDRSDGRFDSEKELRDHEGYLRTELSEKARVLVVRNPNGGLEISL